MYESGEEAPKVRKCFFCINVIIVVCVGLIMCSRYMDYFHAGLPEMEIRLKGVSLNEINKGEKENKYEGNTVVISFHGDKRLFDSVTLKGRGNFSWTAEKKSYNLKFSKKTKLLNLRGQKKWGLIANSLDDTLLRNDIGHYISNVVVKDHPIYGDFVNLVIDGEDLGLYYLSELVSIDKNSVDIKNTLGVLVEFDKVYCLNEQHYYTSEILHDCMTLKDAVDDNNSELAMNNYMDYYNKFERLLLNADYNEVFNYVDKESWAEYYLLSEFTGNVDAYVTSWFLYKDGLDGKINVGPGWDFDAGFGNKNWWEDWSDEYYDPNLIMSRLKYSFDERADYVEGQKMGCRYDYKGKEGSLAYVSPIMCYMIDIPEFNDEVSRLYKERLMDKRDEVLTYIRNRANYIRAAAIKDNEMWGKGDFDKAVEYLVWWVDKRFDLFDRLYGEVKTEFLEEPSEV